MASVQASHILACSFRLPGVRSAFATANLCITAATEEIHKSSGAHETTRIAAARGITVFLFIFELIAASRFAIFALRGHPRGAFEMMALGGTRSLAIRHASRTPE